MAHIFKHPDATNKGIIVFTHKEWGFFAGNKIIRKLKRELETVRSWMPELRQPYASQLSELKQHYFIGVHFGCYYPNHFSSSIVDFVMSGESNLPNLDSSISRIPFNSREFIPADFHRSSDEKKFDVMAVAQNVKVKNYPLLFDSIKATMKERPDTSFLLICPSQEGVKFGIERDLAKHFYQTFTSEEQAKIAFFFLHPQLEWGIHQSQLARFYQMSRVFTLFSKQEGESRVISEALCCGLPVVVYSNLLGGGRDLLNDKNSVMFDDYGSAHKSFISALQKFPEGTLEKTEKLTREDFSIERLRNCLTELYKANLQNFDGQLINLDHLDRRLPGHHYAVPWRISGNPTADVLSKKQFSIFCTQLEG